MTVFTKLFLCCDRKQFHRKPGMKSKRQKFVSKVFRLSRMCLVVCVCLCMYCVVENFTKYIKFTTSKAA